MEEIKVLPPDLANLIAAGEVVERPASVVKELLENAIDAGATSLNLEIRGGGLEQIRVTDNGRGIPASQLPTAFLRHATSKLWQPEQLSAIRTLGFRGEALAAIAAVSRVEITSGEPGQLFAQRLSLEGGQVIQEEQTGAPAGTTILVKDLFFNTPARLKFMKSARAEGAAILTLAQQIALSHPELRVSCRREGKEELATRGDGKLRSSALAVFGQEITGQLTDISWEEGDYRLGGLSCLPTACRGSRNFQHFFVNGRYIKSKLLQQALEAAYENQRMVGKFPVAILHLELPVDQLDVNVHPAKTLVKFAQEPLIFQLVEEGVRECLSKKRDIPSLTGSGAGKAQPLALHSPATRQAPPPHQRPPAQGEDGFWLREAPGEQPTSSPGKGPGPSPNNGGISFDGGNQASPLFSTFNRTETGKHQPLYQEKAQNSDLDPDLNAHLDSPPPPWEGQPPVGDCPWEDLGEDPGPVLEDGPQPSPWEEQLPQDFVLLPPPVEEEEELEQEEIPMEELPWRVVGEFFHAYIAVEQGDQLLFLDKHAIHERVNFNRLKEKGYQPMAQMLLTPVVVNLAPKERAILLEHHGILEEYAFDLEESGLDALVVRQSPFDIAPEKIADTLTELADRLLSGGKIDSQTARDHLLHTMACKAAIKAGWHSQEEEYAQVVKMVMDQGIQHCPHGRPVVVSFTRKELEKRLKRC